MAREYARVKLAVWADDDFRTLSVGAQHLYFVLLTSPKLDYCGVTDWRPGRIAALAGGWSISDVETAAKELTDRLYLVIDEETEEVLIRSFIRNDGLMDQPNMAVSMMNAQAAVASTALRQIVVHELRRLHVSNPSLKGWVRVETMLDRPSLDPSDYPSFTPSVRASVTPSDRAPVTDQPTPSVDPSPTTAPTPAPTPTPSSRGAAKRRTRLPSDWKPTPADVDWQREAGITDLVARRQLEVFRDHWKANAETKADWSATWRNWLRRAPQFDRNTPTPTPPADRRPGDFSHLRASTDW